LTGALSRGSEIWTGLPKEARHAAPVTGFVEVPLHTVALNRLLHITGSPKRPNPGAESHCAEVGTHLYALAKEDPDLEPKSALPLLCASSEKYAHLVVDI
jgi:hypothetical protein